MRKNELKQKKEDFLKAFENNHALVLKSCREVSMSPPTLYKWLDNDEEFKTRYEEIKKLNVEKVESKLFEAIDNGDMSAIKFYLNTRGGYTEKQEVQVDVKEYEIKLD